VMPAARGRRAALLGAKILAAVVSLGVLLGSGYAWSSLQTLSSSLTTIDTGPVVVASTGAAAALKANDKDENILLIGDDSRENASAKALAALGTDANPGDNTDTIMVLHIPADGKKATLLSFPRDALVEIPGGYGTQKINSAYSDGVQAAGNVSASAKIGAGVRKLEETITDLTGLRINHFVKVSMFGFYDISNAIHGIDVDMCAAANKYTEGDSTHPNGYSGINLKKGWNHIAGFQALAFVRQRHGLTGGDYSRIVRQEYFLSAVFRKIATPGSLANPLTVRHLVQAIGKSLTVDTGLSPGALLQLGLQLKDLSAGNLYSATIPMLGADYVDDNPQGQYLGESVDNAAMPAFIKKLIGQAPAKKPVAKPTVSPSAGSTGKATPTTAPFSAPAGASSDPAIRAASNTSCVN
jgi:LCP family protein required for cell wall assembly